MTRKTRNSRINRRARNLIKSIKSSLSKIKRRSMRKAMKGGDGNMGHTVHTESFFGRDKIGFGALEDSPQPVGASSGLPGYDSNTQGCPYDNLQGGGRRRGSRRSGRKVRGGDGQMGHTVHTESYFGRDKIGFGPLEDSPQRGAGRLESAGHWNQPTTGWEKASNICNSKLEGDVQVWGGGRRRNSKHCGIICPAKPSNKKKRNSKSGGRKSRNRSQKRNYKSGGRKSKNHYSKRKSKYGNRKGCGSSH